MPISNIAIELPRSIHHLGRQFFIYIFFFKKKIQKIQSDPERISPYRSPFLICIRYKNDTIVNESRHKSFQWPWQLRRRGRRWILTETEDHNNRREMGTLDVACTPESCSSQQGPSPLVVVFPTRKLDGNVGGNGIMYDSVVEKDIRCPSRRHDDSG